MEDKELSIQNYKNYSKEDGQVINILEVKEYTIEKSVDFNCKNCGLENDNKDIYCKNCGSELYRIIENNDSRDSKYDIKSVFLTSISSIIILFIMATIYKGIIFFEGVSLNDIVNPLHILLAMNLGEIHVLTTSMLSSGVANIQVGVLVMVMLPIVALIVTNLIFMKKSNNDIKCIILNSIAVGAFYSVILSILSIFSKVRINTSDMFMYSSAIVYGFTFLSVLINAFIIGFVSTLISGLLRIKEKTMYSEVIIISLKTIGLGIISLLAIVSILSLFNKSFIHELGLYTYVNKISLGVVLIQLAVYLWGVANLIPVVIGKISLSVIGLGNSSLSSDIKLIIIAIFIISALILIIAGNKLKNSVDNGNINPVKYFSISYSLIMGTLGLISTIIVNGNGVSPLVMGYEVIVAIVVSYIYSFVVTLIGYKLS